MERFPAPATIGLFLQNEADRRLLADFLKENSFQTKLVTACDLAKGTDVGSLLIIDERSAKGQINELLDLKRNAQPLHLPILITLIGAASATPWLRAGFDDVLRLPMAKDDLIARLEAFLRLRLHSEYASRENYQRFRATFDLAPVGIVHASENGTLLFVNRRFCDMVGYAECELAGSMIQKLMHQLDIDTLFSQTAAMLSEHIPVVRQFDLRLETKTMTTLWTSVTASLIRDAIGLRARFIFAVENISSRKQMEDALRESEELFKSTIDALPEHICVMDENGHILMVNRAWAEFTLANGGRAEMWQEMNYIDVCEASAAQSSDARHFTDGLKRVLTGDCKEFSHEYPCDSPEEERWFIVKVTRFCRNGAPRLVVSHENVTERKQAEKRLTHLAHFDSLTSLPNRTLFYDRLSMTLLQAKRSEWIVAVLFVDLDHFKTVNDTLGHAAGDDLLKQATRRIHSCLRNTDTIGRLGGDEFGIFLPDLASDRDAALVAQKIMMSLSKPFPINGSEAFITSSIGISLFPSDSSEVDALVVSADTAMYRAKQQGRNNFQFFTSTMNAEVVERAKIENGLRRALERDELSLHYQPQIDVRSGRVKAVEALLRWQHADLGNVSPASFIPVAEETGMIVPIGEWVLRTACRQNKAWQDAGYPPVVMAVNLSARQFKLNDMVSTVACILNETGLDPSYLELEITEGVVMENHDILVLTLHQLKQLGVRLSIDDFGTGYSNLGYLGRFPLDALKIDRSFVSVMGKSNNDGVIAETIIALAHGLKLEVIAEGVEEMEQYDALRALGCDFIQGYLFSRPLCAEKIVSLFAEMGSSFAVS